MKTDRELLELAAKAAGIATYDYGGECFTDNWNPLTDDGDALRLAVKLKIHISGFFDKVTTDTDYRAFCEMYKGDPYAATRRCITRAAATIGETL